MEFVFQFVLSHMKLIEIIVFWYPVIMGMLWVIGGVIYYYRIERKEPLPLPSTPMVSVLVPAYNESDNLFDVVEQLNSLNYPNYEILIINDGSSDDTSKKATILSQMYERVRFIDLQENCGKANALYLGFIASKGEYLVCVDGDSYLDKDCLRYLMSHFLNTNNGERVGAVTGNPRVRNRSSLFAKIQLCEYASIISLIKRTQRIWGKVMTVSGVVVAYRKQALMDCGLWDRDIITEDIGVTWKLERNFWDVRYEPNALCWMLVPETLKGLVKQRKRWAQGGQEVMFRHAGIFRSWRRRRLYPIYFEQIMSLVWVVLWLLLTLTELIKLCYNVGSYMPYIWKSQFLSVICMIQFVVALRLENKYDKGLFKYMIAAAWYPTIYWMVSGIVALLAIPSTLVSRKNKLARWNSPDRGIDTAESVSLEDCVLEESMEQGLNEGELAKQQLIATKLSDNSDENAEKRLELQNEKRTHIIDGKQVWWKKIFEVLFTTMAWVFILIYLFYIIYGWICIAIGKVPFHYWIYNEQMLLETGHLIYVTFIIVLIEIVVMIFWKEYNRIRYGKLHRRKFKPDVTMEEIAEFFAMDKEDVGEMQNDKIVTLPQNIIPDNFKAERKIFSGNKIA